LRKSLRKILKKLRLGRDNASPKPHAATNMRGRSSLTAVSLPGSDITGQTVFDDRPLRFKNLTLDQANVGEFDDAPDLSGAFKIRVGTQAGTRREAVSLVQRRYMRRGYQTPGRKHDPHLTTFIAFDEGQIVGTVGLRLDSAVGLSADDLYRPEIDILRAAGSRMCEFTRLAVDSTAASKPVLAGLFHTAYLYASVIHGYTDAVIEVNPRHVAYYERALNFAAIGPERLNASVNAPAVLLRVPFSTIADGLKKYAGKIAAHGARRSLFPYGFPPNEEVGVLRRLRELAKTNRAAIPTGSSTAVKHSNPQIS